MKIHKLSSFSDDDRSQCSCCILQITTPAPFQRLERLQTIEGVAEPCESVRIFIDNYPPLEACADSCGRFSVTNPYDLAIGPHTIRARSCPSDCCVCISFCIEEPEPVPVPTLESPECGSTIADPSPWISGRGVAGNSVRVCIEGFGCQSAEVDQNGEYHVNFGIAFPDGTYNITVTQIGPSGNESPSVFCSFTIDTASFMVEPIDDRMGRTFRTVDIDVLMSGTTGTATVYYLLLPPGSPAPSADEIMNYGDTASLLDGSAATGRFAVSVEETPTEYTWALTGLDNPNAPAGATGVVDGYRYDVYIYVVSGAFDSGVLTFPRDGVMGMPFASGLGTPDDPFTIRELTEEELQMYPDLLADNPLNRPGVDENARQLENIERLVTLYEETSGYYGLGDSMELSYLMSSDIDLAAYAAAYDGAGWESIGDIDGWINDRKETEHLFSGVFDGGGHTIENLSITPVATDDYFVGYRGLFGGVEYGTIKNLTLSGVRIDAFTTTPGFAQLGAFIATSRNPTLSALSLINADITADCDSPLIGDPHQINIGGFVAEIFDGATVSDITGQGISIAVPSEHALALGGFVGYTDKFEATDSFDNISLSAVSISGYAMIGGFAGYVVYNVNRLTNAAINHITITAPGGEAGGLIGRNYIFGSGGDQLIENCTVQNISIAAGSTGSDVGGLIGAVRQNPFARTTDSGIVQSRAFEARPDADLSVFAAWPMTTIRLCSVAGGQISCAGNGGGLIGALSVSGFDTDASQIVTLCKASIPVAGTASGIGGLIGECINAVVSQSFSSGAASTGAGAFGGLIGQLSGSEVEDCYATGAASGGAVGGGDVGEFDSSLIERCYSTGNVSAASTAGGIAGSGTGTSLQNSLVLGGAITAPAVHRILGANSGAALANNYALSTVTPAPGMTDPNGLDGGTITSAQIVSTMQGLGWDTGVVWNTASVASLGRPTLIENPE